MLVQELVMMLQVYRENVKNKYGEILDAQHQMVVMSGLTNKQRQH
jgi:hypothetical protein